MPPLTSQPSNKTEARPPLRVALVEDQPDTRESWRQLISSFPDFTCVCASATGEEALRTIPGFKPDVILMDIFLPRMTGIECTSRLKTVLPKTPIVMLTASDEDEMVFLALKAGANGYLLKRTKPAELRAALLDVLSGGAPMTSEIARHVINSFHTKGTDQSETVSLTAREVETLVLLTKGYSNKEIADKVNNPAQRAGLWTRPL
jgi:DNA-binding NarL/FixJ family response regulator